MQDISTFFEILALNFGQSNSRVFSESLLETCAAIYGHNRLLPVGSSK